MSSTDKAKLDGIAYGANNYTLPTASANTLGGIKTGYNDTADAGKWAVKVDNNGNAFVPISGLYHDSDNFVSNLVIGSSNLTSFNGSSIVFSSRDHGDYSCNFPKRGGTFALTSDLSDLCRFNFVNSVSECKSDRINFLLRYPDNINLDTFDSYPDGTILLINTKYSATIKHSSGTWYSCGDSLDKTNYYYTGYREINLITKNNGIVYHYVL